MALTFGALTSDRVDCGSGASVDDLGGGAMSALVWAFATTLTVNRKLIGKNNAAASTAGWALGVDQVSTTQLQFTWGGSTTLSCVTNDGPMSTGKWICYAVGSTFGGTTTLYTGDLTTPLAARTLGTNTAGVTRNSDAAVRLFIGNIDRTAGINRAWQGQIAIALVWNRALTLGELKAQQFSPHIISDGSCKGYWQVGFNGTGTQADWSGNGNNGTVTGATVADHVPLGPMVYPSGWLGAFGAPTFSDTLFAQAVM